MSISTLIYRFFHKIFSSLFFFTLVLHLTSPLQVFPTHCNKYVTIKLQKISKINSAYIKKKRFASCTISKLILWIKIDSVARYERNEKKNTVMWLCAPAIKAYRYNDRGSNISRPFESTVHLVSGRDRENFRTTEMHKIL